MTHFLNACAVMTAALIAIPAAAAPVDLEVGATETISTGGAITQVIIDVPDIVSTKLPSARLLAVTGLKPGNANITVVSAGGARANYPVHVAEAGANDSAELRRRLGDHSELGGVAVARRDGRYILSGSVPDVAAHSRAVSLAEGLGGKEMTDLIQVDGNQMVAVDVRFVAVSDTTLKSLGFNFSKLSGGFQTALVGPNGLNGYKFSGSGLQVDSNVPLQNAFNLFLASRGDGILGVLSALSDTGLSQVLAQPTLLARSGEQAEFLAGGEIPVPVPQAGNGSGAITIEYRQYGVRLSVEPYVMSNRRIVLKLAPEVSELDYTNRVTIQGFNIPGFRRRSANTTVELGDGESFVIAGLTYANSATNESKVPMFGDIPLLGSLFRRTERSLEKLELIIVATPRLVSPLKDAEVAQMLPTRLSSPSLSESVLKPASAEKRAANFGLSR